MFGSKSTSSLKFQTEKALKTIDEYEKAQHKKNLLSTMYTAIQHNHPTTMQVAHKQFFARQIVRIQLLPNTIAYYRMTVTTNLQPKIIIRNLRGGPGQLYINYDRLPRQLAQACYHYCLRSQLIIKLDPKSTMSAKYIFLVFKSNKNLTMLNFRMDQLNQKKKKKPTAKTDQSILSLASIENESKEKDREKSKLKRMRSARRLKSVQSEDLFANRPQNRRKKIQSLKQAEKQRKQAAIKRIENTQIFKEKDAEARIVCFKCKNLVDEYDDLVAEEARIKKQLLRQHLPAIYLIKFALLSNTLTLERQKNMDKVFMIKNYARKFEKKLRTAYRQTRIMIPDHPTRQLQTLTHQLNLTSFTLFRKSEKKASSVILDCLQSCKPALLINLSMTQASKYRRYIRDLQKKWRSKYQNRMRMLLIYTEWQFNSIVKTYPHLKEIQHVYRERNAAASICQQYQKDVAGKLKEHRKAYQQKLEEIEQYKQLNEQIKAHNSTALKKRQKQLLEVPKKPSEPIFRFFRDLIFLKSLVRGWLQVEHRRWKRKNLPSKKMIIQQG